MSRRKPREWSAARCALTSTACALLGVAVLGLSACSSSSRSATTSTTLRPQTTGSTAAASAPPLYVAKSFAGLVGPRFVVVIDGNPLLVGADGRVAPLVPDLHTIGALDAAVGDSVLINFDPAGLIFAGPTADHFPGAVPAGITLLPDALARWSSDFGTLDEHGNLAKLSFPAGTEPVARLGDEYLLVDSGHTALLRWQAGSPVQKIATGATRVLAVAEGVVAWASGNDKVAHITNLRTGKTVSTPQQGYVVTGRFSPDGKRLALSLLTDDSTTALLDTASGHVLAQFRTSSAQGGLRQSRRLPSGLQPVPFAWNPKTGQLLVVDTSSRPPMVEWVRPSDGAVVRSAIGPAGLSQVLLLGG